MDLKRSKLQQIPQRNKDLTFGYVNKCEKMNRTVIPNMIKYLCLIYLNTNYDEFDKNNTHKALIIMNNLIKGAGVDREEPHQTSYLTNIAHKGTHVWIFKCFQTNQYKQNLIGIRKVEQGSLALTGYFDEGYGHESVGYGLFTTGLLTNPQDSRDNGRRYTSKLAQGTHIIKMTLNCKNWSLSYEINNTDHSKAFDIKPGQYRAAISFRQLTIIVHASR